MKRGLLLSLVALFVGCGDSLPDAQQAAVHVDVSYDFKAGCIAVLARDKGAQDKQTSEQIPVLGEAPVEGKRREADFAVFRKEDWGRTIEIVVTAHEQTCDGPIVATETFERTLDKAGTQTVQVSLTAIDKDDDGYMAQLGGDGTDCDDDHAGSNPGVTTELCDGRDNDCVGGVDNGLTQSDFFLDADGDGAGGGPVRKACAAPPNHVTNSNDCDDTNGERTPGKSEVCDGIDNNCADGVDDGLIFTDYYIDEDGDGVGAGVAQSACAPIAGRVTTGNDCDDGNAQRTPGKSEVCDELDNDCNGPADDGLPTSAFYFDGDSDGFGSEPKRVDACRAPQGYVGPDTGFDCDDASAAVNPGATEVCNNIDDNCAGGTDEGFDKNWYRDGDGDGFGLSTDTMVSCAQPSGYVHQGTGFDCNDGNDAVKPGATELCNDIDDNCVGGIDENFADKGQPCTNDVCNGQRVCNAAGDGTQCNAPAPMSYFPDVDGDTEGSSSASATKICAPDSPPPNHVTNNADCDDGDFHNRTGGTEVCDDRDNDCDEVKDDGNVCGGKTWKQLPVSVVPAYNWNTVAVGQSGYPVYLAGEAGALAFRTPFVSTFLPVDTSYCGTANWSAAWAHPTEGVVFLAGDGGALAAFNSNSATCATANTTAANPGSSNRALEGIIGFGSGASTTVYVVNDQGAVFSWTPGSNPVFKAQRSGTDPFRDIHGMAASNMLVGGVTHPGNHVFIQGFDGTTLTTHTYSDLPGGNTGNKAIFGVWAWDTNQAYAAGKDGALFRWDGNTTWAFVSPDTNMNQDLNSIIAFDRYSAYVASQDGKIRRPGTGAWVEHFTASGALKDIAGKSREDIWAVGNGIVVHFPEPP